MAVSDYVCVFVDDLGVERCAVVRNHQRADGFWALLTRALDVEKAEAVPAEMQPIVAAIRHRLAPEH